MGSAEFTAQGKFEPLRTDYRIFSYTVPVKDAEYAAKRSDRSPPPARPIRCRQFVMPNDEQSRESDPAGSRPRVPAGRRIYAIGDIHGRADLLQSVHQLIRDDAADYVPDGVAVIYLGDYIDRGPHSFEVINLLINDPLTGFETVFLKGNHDDFLLRFAETGENASWWLINGAEATLASYGVNVSSAVERECLWADFRAALPYNHQQFFQGLRLSHREGDYLFVHAGIRPGVALSQQTPFDLMWIREEFLEADEDFGVVVVHGHTPRPEPEIALNRISIDTFAYHSGCLTCLVLEGEERSFLST